MTPEQDYTTSTVTNYKTNYKLEFKDSRTPEQKELAREESRHKELMSRLDNIRHTLFAVAFWLFILALLSL